MTFVDRAAGCLTDRCERLGQQVIDRLPCGKALLELLGLLTQLGVGQPGEVGLQGVHLLGDGLQASQSSAFTGAQHFFEEFWHPARLIPLTGPILHQPVSTLDQGQEILAHRVTQGPEATNQGDGRGAAISDDLSGEVVQSARRAQEQGCASETGRHSSRERVGKALPDAT